MSRTVKKLPSVEQASAMKIEQCAEKESGYDGPPLTTPEQAAAALLAEMAAQPRKADDQVKGNGANVLVPTECVKPTEAAELVKGNAGNRPLTPYNPLPDGERRMATSIPLSTPKGQLDAYRAMSNQDHRAEDVIGKRWPVVNWLQHDCQKVDQATGEIQRWVRTVLICEDGTRISCGSDGVIGSIMSLEAFFGKPPWAPAKMLSIETGKSRAGYTYYTLDVH